MSDVEDILELGGQEVRSPKRTRRRGPRGNPWLAVYWRCCRVYSRIYRNRQGSAYEGRCPKCGRPVQAKIGRDGTSARFFEAG